MDVMTSCPDIARLVGDLFVYAAWGVLSFWLVLDVVAGGFYDVAKLVVRRVMARRVASVPFAERVRMLEAREEQAAVFRQRIRQRIAREDQRHGGAL
jgi:hypothetical protein